MSVAITPSSDPVGAIADVVLRKSVKHNGLLFGFLPSFHAATGRTEGLFHQLELLAKKGYCSITIPIILTATGGKCELKGHLTLHPEADQEAVKSIKFVLASLEGAAAEISSYPGGGYSVRFHLFPKQTPKI